MTARVWQEVPVPVGRILRMVQITAPTWSVVSLYRESEEPGLVWHLISGHVIPEAETVVLWISLPRRAGTRFILEATAYVRLDDLAYD